MYLLHQSSDLFLVFTALYKVILLCIHFYLFIIYFNKCTISKLRLFCAFDNQHFPTQKHLPLQESDDRKTYYLKIHAPWEVLATYADVLKIKVPFKASDIPKAREVPLEWLTHPFRLPDKIMRPEPDYFTAPFDKSKVDFFLIDDKDTFFPPSTRNRIVYYILTRCPYYKEDRKEKDKTGINRLLNNGTYTSAYPLHDVSVRFMHFNLSVCPSILPFKSLGSVLRCFFK